jgi:hypothetical protein
MANESVSRAGTNGPRRRFRDFEWRAIPELFCAESLGELLT